MSGPARAEAFSNDLGLPGEPLLVRAGSSQRQHLNGAHHDGGESGGGDVPSDRSCRLALGDARDDEPPGLVDAPPEPRGGFLWKGEHELLREHESKDSCALSDGLTASLDEALQALEGGSGLGWEGRVEDRLDPLGHGLEQGV